MTTQPISLSALPRPARAALDALDALADGRPHDERHRAALAAWPGWGPLAPAFNSHPDPQWRGLRAQLEDRLTRKELTSATSSVDNAFLTPSRLVQEIYATLSCAGVTGGRILEPGCGPGRFMTDVPASWEVVDFVGVESDPITARIAAALHPTAQIIASRMEQTTFVAGTFDLAVGNVPFSTTPVYDSASRNMSSLYSYMITRALQAVRDGGYLALIVPCGFIDSSPSHTPALLAGAAELVAAVRLPSGTFAREGTATAADVVFLRKDSSAKTRYYVQPEQKLTNPRTATTYTVAGYWLDNPDLVAGTLQHSGYHAAPLAVFGSWADTVASLEAARDRVQQRPADPDPHNLAPFTVEELPTGPDGEPLLEGEFHVAADGAVRKVRDGELVDVARPSVELRALLGLRDAATRLLELECDHLRRDDDPELVQARAAALDLYEAYVARWGALNRGQLLTGKVDPETGAPQLSWRRPPMGGFRSDPAYVTVMALEDFEQSTGRAAPAPILLRRVNRPPRPVESVSTPDEAVAVCLGERGRIDVGRIGALLGVPAAQVESVLGDRAFPDPSSGALVPARDYLSGDVVTKLDRARAAAVVDRRYQRCVSALEAVQPAPLGPLDVKASLGSPWLATDDIKDFYRDLTGGYATVHRCEQTGTWEVDAGTTAGGAQWGMPRMSAAKLVEYGCNNRSPIVYDETYVNQRAVRVRNDELTAAAAAKLSAIRERFELWLWQDPQRTTRLLAEYNRRFNRWVRRVSDGSYLPFTGLSDSIDLWRHQRGMVDRVISQERAFCGHAVGAGKTLSMVASVMTLRQMGLASKPMLAVPGHLLEQIAREAAQAYPMGRFLIAGKEDLAGERRRSFAARCATGDWDCVVMTHQGFGSLPVHPSREMSWFEHQIADFEDALRSSGAGISGKVLSRRLKSLRGRLERLRDGKVDPRTIYFERLGIDFLGVDECHAMKRLEVASRAEGFTMGASKRAADLLLKVDLLQERAQGRPHLALFTGTPFTNTFAETYVWQKFTQPDALEQAGLYTFDQWAAVFAQMQTVIEVAPDGSGFRPATRVTHIRNVPELRAMFDQVADILPASKLALDRPARVARDVVTAPTPQQREFITGLVARADALRHHGPRDVDDTTPGQPGQPGRQGQPRKDNMLAICGDGRRVALDPWLVGVPSDGPKVAAAVHEIASRYHRQSQQIFPQSEVPGTLQIVFCDQGTPGPKKGSQTYGRLRAGLIAAGVPADRIRWIHDAKTDAAKAALFAACRDGAVSVLIGSTEKMGHGTNVQARVSAIHHVDAPWRPSDIEQREGRGIRPGNWVGEVEIIRHVCQGTFDAFMFQKLTQKAQLNAQMYEAEPTAREIEDLGDVVLGYAELTAVASGNPLLLERATVAARVKQLRMVKVVDQQSVVTARRRADDLDRSAATAIARAELLDLVPELASTTDETSVSRYSLERFNRSLPASRRKAKLENRDITEWVSWRNLHLTLQWRAATDEVGVRVRATTLGGATVEAVAIPRNHWLRMPAEDVEAELTAFVNSCGKLATRERARAAEHETTAKALRAEADGYRFAQHDELSRLEARLMVIDHEMECAAQPRSQAA